MLMAKTSSKKINDVCKEENTYVPGLRLLLVTKFRIYGFVGHEFLEMSCKLDMTWRFIS